jgi:hypothetical protein
MLARPGRFLAANQVKDNEDVVFYLSRRVLHMSNFRFAGSIIITLLSAGSLIGTYSQDNFYGDLSRIDDVALKINNSYVKTIRLTGLPDSHSLGVLFASVISLSPFSTM